MHYTFDKSIFIQWFALMRQSWAEFSFMQKNEAVTTDYESADIEAHVNKV